MELLSLGVRISWFDDAVAEQMQQFSCCKRMGDHGFHQLWKLSHKLFIVRAPYCGPRIGRTSEQYILFSSLTNKFKWFNSHKSLVNDDIDMGWKSESIVNDDTKVLDIVCGGYSS